MRVFSVGINFNSHSITAERDKRELFVLHYVHDHCSSDGIIVVITTHIFVWLSVLSFDAPVSKISSFLFPLVPRQIGPIRITNAVLITLKHLYNDTHSLARAHTRYDAIHNSVLTTIFLSFLLLSALVSFDLFIFL